ACPGSQQLSRAAPHQSSRMMPFNHSQAAACHPVWPFPPWRGASPLITCLSIQVEWSVVKLFDIEYKAICYNVLQQLPSSSSQLFLHLPSNPPDCLFPRPASFSPRIPSPCTPPDPGFRRHPAPAEAVILWL